MRELSVTSASIDPSQHDALRQATSVGGLKDSLLLPLLPLTYVEIFDQLEIMPSRRVRVARLLGWKAGGSRLKGSDARALEDGFKILGPVTLDSRI